MNKNYPSVPFKYCPNCGAEVYRHFTSSFDAFTHENPLIGLTIYGPVDVFKKIHCRTKELLHFSINGEHRLVTFEKKEWTPQPEDYDQNNDPGCTDCNDRSCDNCQLPF
jgi:hypothetical protein